MAARARREASPTSPSRSRNIARSSRFRPFQLFVFAVFLLLGLTPDQAFAGAVGMCGDDAQSIDAPPPLYPSDGAVLGGSTLAGNTFGGRLTGGSFDASSFACDSVDARRGIEQAPAPTEQPRQLQLEPRTDFVLFSLEVVCARASTEPLAFIEGATLISEEHKDSLRRPPRL